MRNTNFPNLDQCFPMRSNAIILCGHGGKKPSNGRLIDGTKRASNCIHIRQRRCMSLASQFLNTTVQRESEPNMTEIDIEKEQLGSKKITEGVTAMANNSDGSKLNERATLTGARQARKPSEDEDPFDNMPL
jgi:hypothetical protein